MTFDLNSVLNELADAIEKEFAAAAPVDKEPEAPSEPDTSANAADALSVEGLALEAIRLLQKAEATEYVDEGEQLIRIADRYIRLTELALAANAIG